MDQRLDFFFAQIFKTSVRFVMYRPQFFQPCPVRSQQCPDDYRLPVDSREAADEETQICLPGRVLNCLNFCGDYGLRSREKRQCLPTLYSVRSKVPFCDSASGNPAASSAVSQISMSPCFSRYSLIAVRKRCPYFSYFACPTPEGASRTWDAAEDEELKREFGFGMKIAEIARQHDRTYGAIRARLKKQGMIE